MKKQTRTNKTAKLTVRPKKMAITAPTKLYDSDFFLWTEQQSDFLKTHRFDDLDIENLLEEIEALGKRDMHSLRNYLIVFFQHLLKLKFQKMDFTNSWERSIKHSQNQIGFLLLDSPSLKRKLPELLKQAYKAAREEAAVETKLPLKTFPEELPEEFLKKIPQIGRKARM